MREQLMEDVNRLRSEKAALRRDVEQLQQQRSQILREQQRAEQQQWAQEFAKILARYLQQQLQQDFRQTIQAQTPPQLASQGVINPQLEQLMNQTLETLQQDLNRYQAHLEQQLESMQRSSRDGELLLENLVQRLRLELGTQPLPSSPAITPQPPPFQQPAPPGNSAPRPRFTVVPDPSGVTPPTPAPTSPPKAPPIVRWKRPGIALTLLSSLMLGLQYVLAQALFQFPSVNPTLGGNNQLELLPNWGNTALLVGLRMVVLLPLIGVFNYWVQPRLLGALREFLWPSTPRSPNRTLWVTLILSSLFLFLSQWFLYRAVGETSASLGVSLFFLYPALTPLLTWALQREAPSQFRLQCMAALGVGGSLIFSQPPVHSLSGENMLVWSLASAGLFAGYLFLTDRCNRQLNPLVVSLVQYGLVIGLSLPALVHFTSLSPVQGTKLLIGGLILGATAALSYILNVFSVQIMGSLPSMMLSGLTPLITAAIGLLLLQSPITVAQGLGLILITLGTIALNLERLRPGALS